ncbi:MAG: peptide chain release factor N(5)-glutamine methyltransferase [Pedobacter sp.]|nr:peptide chain release factor N(5)-glutamine methyltransferase [Pedobacter sp.]
MKLKALSTKFTETLSHLYPQHEAETLFYIAVAHVLSLNRTNYLLKKENEITDDVLSRFETILTALESGQPIQYVLGEAPFYGLNFKVDPSVLIPRPETEELVSWMLQRIEQDLGQPLSILDIGTGSGCIAIALKKNLAQAAVYALDVSSTSLNMAKKNASLNEASIEFIEMDILSAAELPLPSYSCIVSNPPYIKVDEQPDMHHNVLQHEPALALFVSNEDPLIFYRKIADLAIKYLTKGGLLFFEINEYLGEETVDLLKSKGLKNIELKKDMQGKDRMVCAIKS